jgi:mono/diheme cytochrome c family protein
MRIIVATLLLTGIVLPTLSAAKAADRFAVPQDVQAVLAQRCIDCHGDDSAEGDVRLDGMDQLGLAARLDLLNKAQEQLFLGQMPPGDEEQPTAAERARLAEWVSQELHKNNASKLEGKLQKPEFGNYVNHEQLFSGEFKDLPGFTYDRRWLISEYIFSAKFQQMLQGRSTARRNKRNVPVFGSNRFNQLSLTNPFLLPTRSGVRYYANTDLTGGHLSSMLTNAQKTSEHVTDYLVKRNAKYLPAITAIMALEDKHNATLASRRQFLEYFIAQLCDEFYGSENEALLPKFIPVTLKEVETLEEGETYKKAPFHVAQNMLKGLEGENTVYQSLLNPEHENKSDEEFQALCERIWFYFGDHERKIQGRMTILRDYMPEIRDNLDKNRRKFRLIVYKPLGDDEMKVIQASIRKHRNNGEHYAAIIDKCMAEWEQEFAQQQIQAGPPADELLSELVDQLSVQILERSPDAAEADEYLALSKSYVKKLGNLKGIQKLIQTFILSSEFAYRQEFGSGEADEHGRRMLSPRDSSYAIAYALTDQSPDAELVQAVESGRLKTKDDYKREVNRILKKREVYYLVDPILADKNYQDNTTDTAIRKLRFFREFFGYPKALTIFKDEKRFGGDRLGNATNRLINEADRLVEHILENDQNVFEELLTTEKFYVYHDGDNERMQAASDRIKRIYEYFKEHDWQNFDYEELGKHKEFLREVKMRSINPDKLESGNRSGSGLRLFNKSMTSITARLDKGQKEAAPFDMYRGYGSDFMPGENVSKFFNYPLTNWDYATVQPAKVPNRKGFLTHPAWLIAHAQNTETDPVIRGKWIREKLLAGTIPDVPITVDAVIPEDHHKSLRDRLASATEVEYCWKCHKHMNPLGYAFEAYDDFGRFRLQESLESPENLVKKNPDEAPDRNHLLELRDVYKTVPVDATGYLKDTGDDSLDGEIRDAIDLAERLGKSRRVRQSIIRHAFRYFMGRNENLSDSSTLIDAEQAYVDTNGSFDAVIVSLLTSDSFIYRKAIED